VQQLPHRSGFLTLGVQLWGASATLNRAVFFFRSSFGQLRTSPFKTFVLGLVVGALGGYGLGRWLPMAGAAGTGKPPALAVPPVGQTAEPPGVSPSADSQGPAATHPPLTAGNNAPAPQAVRAACQSADANPGNYLAQMDAAAALYQAGRFAEALNYAQRAHHLRPDSLDALLAVGVSQAELGQYDAAVKTLTQAVERRPDDADTRTELAYVHLRRKDYRSALNEAERAHRLAAHAERTLEIIIQAALALGETRRAKVALDQLAAVNPGNPRLAELARLVAAATPTKKGKSS